MKMLIDHSIHSIPFRTESIQWPFRPVLQLVPSSNPPSLEAWRGLGEGGAEEEEGEGGRGSTLHCFHACMWLASPHSSIQAGGGHLLPFPVEEGNQPYCMWPPACTHLNVCLSFSLLDFL